MKMFQSVLRGTAIPLAWLRLLQIEPVYQHRHLGSAHRYAVLFLAGGGPAEAAFLQPLRAHPQSAAIPHQGFQTRACAIRKQEQMPTQRVLPQLIAHGSVQSVEALAHVHGFHRYIDLCRQPQPEQRITPRPRVSTGSTQPRRTSTSFRYAVRWPAPARILSPVAFPP